MARDIEGATCAGCSLCIDLGVEYVLLLMERAGNDLATGRNDDRVARVDLVFVWRIEHFTFWKV